MAKFFSRLGEVVRWYPADMPPAERKLLSKLDWLVLSYACLAFFTKYLDVSALTNAYVSGMKEDLNLHGNRLNYINAAYEVGYVVFQIPSNLVITKFPAQYYLPAAEVFWGLFTLGTAFVKTYNQLVVMRFFVGLSATSCYVGLVHIINSWYRKRELARRNALFWISNPLGQMFAGYLQSAAYTNLSNVGGLQGWRWLFIICTVITIPTAFIGFIFFPDVPERTKSRWLTEEEKTLARTRLAEEGFQPSTGLGWGVFLRVVGNWRYWSFVGLLLLFCNMAYASGTPFLLWLSSQPDKYSVPLVNNIGTITHAVAVVSALSTAYYTDLRGRRWEPMVLSGVLCVFSNLVLAVWAVPDGLKFFAYIANGWAQGSIAVIIAWTAENLADDLEVRAVTLASYNAFGEVTGLVVPLVAWQVSHAPTFRGGFIWATVISVLFLLVIGQICWSLRRDERRRGLLKPKPQGAPEELGIVEEVERELDGSAMPIPDEKTAHTETTVKV
ncbi:hypothetical protein A1O3_07820 [Capronia epimyces CBS 606.96]|uniref:Major facilitator superfamily (MFS) profile domain-containing protein n=1 Tax=Capronia epimyces CBS 606.96 TaxID=1182542 RepID=W9XRC5_9EURO|nr:uncharacterized protein A1O3_07820 [Capronia epimyces CBS 606.96]EXJ79541.1 hypothetical protein A1O3_07820 [Capronia epimyces CBS 606.96]